MNKEELKQAKLLTQEEATEYRQVAARINYLAADRPDIGFAAKQICARMATPTDIDRNLLKRLGKYIKGRPRAIAQYWPQNKGERIEAYSDADWAGDPRTGRSTSGGNILIGNHWIRSHSKTQSCITLSTAEAELVAIVKCATEAIGIQSIAMDLGDKYEVNLNTDASAALAAIRKWAQDV